MFQLPEPPENFPRIAESRIVVVAADIERELRSAQRRAEDIVVGERCLRGGSDSGIVVVVRRVAVQCPAAGQPAGIGRVAQLRLRTVNMPTSMAKP